MVPAGLAGQPAQVARALGHDERVFEAGPIESGLENPPLAGGPALVGGRVEENEHRFHGLNTILRPGVHRRGPAGENCVDAVEIPADAGENRQPEKNIENPKARTAAMAVRRPKRVAK